MVLSLAFADWFTNYGHYMKLSECMMGDNFWIAATVILDLSVALGYAIIAIHWWRNARHLPAIPAKKALGTIRNIFIFCGICGYVFIPIKMVWPAWRLYDIVLSVLAFYTWKYALGSRDLKVVYSEIGRTTKLATDLEKSLEDSRRKGLFLNAISHDLRTPLNALMLQTTVAEMNHGDPQLLQAALEEIRSSAAATAALLDSLLEVGRLDWSESNNNLSHFRLSELVVESLNTCKQSADAKNLELESSCSDRIVLATDRVKLERILANLLNNAVKFTERGSVRLDVVSATGGIEIHVIDTGIGISREYQPRLFDDFYQVRNNERDRKNGFGLGLSISRRLARQLGGDITLDSAVGRGTRFTVVLPNTAVAESNGRAVFKHASAGAASAAG